MSICCPAAAASISGIIHHIRRIAKASQTGAEVSIAAEAVYDLFQIERNTDMPNRISVWMAGSLLALPAFLRPPEPTRADVRYGAHERHVIDYYRAPGRGPTP